MNNMLTGTAAIFLTIMTHQVLADSHWRPTPAQEIILRMSKEDTKATLAQILNGVDYPCTPISYRRLGLEPTAGNLVYIEKCREGEYVIDIKRNEGGSTSSMDCPFLKSVARVNCDNLQPSMYINPFPLPE